MRHANEIVREAGMAARPEYYSGRGATTSDLNAGILEKVYRGVKEAVGEQAARSFVQMVDDIPKLTATDFLLTLFRLEASSWIWTPDRLGLEHGIYAADEGSALGTVLSAMGGMGDRDETDIIKGAFIRDHSKELRADQKERAKEKKHFDRFGYSYR